MAKKKTKNVILGAGSLSEVNIYEVNNNDKEVEIPLDYKVKYVYNVSNGIATDISTKIHEKIGEMTATYMDYIFKDPANENRLTDNYYNLYDSSVKNPNINEFVDYSKRPLKLVYWNGKFPFIEYFTYMLPDNMFEIELTEDQNIKVGGVIPETYTPIFVVGS